MSAIDPAVRQLMRERVLAWISTDIGLCDFMAPPAATPDWSDARRQEHVIATIDTLLDSDAARARIMTAESVGNLRRACEQLRAGTASYADVPMAILMLESIWDSVSPGLSTPRWAECSRHFDTAFIAFKILYLWMYTEAVGGGEGMPLSARHVVFAELVRNLFDTSPKSEATGKHSKNCLALLKAWRRELAEYVPDSDLMDVDDDTANPVFDGKFNRLMAKQTPSFTADRIDDFLRVAVDKNWHLEMHQFERDFRKSDVARRVHSPSDKIGIENGKVTQNGPRRPKKTSAVLETKRVPGRPRKTKTRKPESDSDWENDVGSASGGDSDDVDGDRVDPREADNVRKFSQKLQPHHQREAKGRGRPRKANNGSARRPSETEAQAYMMQLYAEDSPRNDDSDEGSGSDVTYQPWRHINSKRKLHLNGQRVGRSRISLPRRDVSKPRTSLPDAKVGKRGRKMLEVHERSRDGPLRITNSVQRQSLPAYTRKRKRSVSDSQSSNESSGEDSLLEIEPKPPRGFMDRKTTMRRMSPRASYSAHTQTGQGRTPGRLSIALFGKPKKKARKSM